MPARHSCGWRAALHATPAHRAPLAESSAPGAAAPGGCARTHTQHTQHTPSGAQPLRPAVHARAASRFVRSSQPREPACVRVPCAATSHPPTVHTLRAPLSRQAGAPTHPHAHAERPQSTLLLHPWPALPPAQQARGGSPMRVAARASTGRLRTRRGARARTPKQPGATDPYLARTKRRSRERTARVVRAAAAAARATTTPLSRPPRAPPPSPGAPASGLRLRRPAPAARAAAAAPPRAARARRPRRLTPRARAGAPPPPAARQGAACPAFNPLDMPLFLCVCGNFRWNQT
jgi:hypothetical protein